MLGKSMIAAVAGVLLFLGAASPMAWAQGVGPGSPTDTDHLLQPVASIPEDHIDWATIIGSAAVPVGVELDPTGPAWTKHFQTENGSLITVTNGVVWIAENLLVSGSVPWTGWHSEIVTDGFVWYAGGSSPTFALIVGGTPIAVTVQTSGSSLDATFPALLPGTPVRLYQKFAWSQETPFDGVIDMCQYPVPEPISLVSLAALFFVSYRKR